MCPLRSRWMLRTIGHWGTDRDLKSVIRREHTGHHSPTRSTREEERLTSSVCRKGAGKAITNPEASRLRSSTGVCQWRPMAMRRVACGEDGCLARVFENADESGKSGIECGHQTNERVLIVSRVAGEAEGRLQET